PLDLGVGRRIRSDRARQLSDPDPVQRPAQPPPAAVEFEGPPGELEAERGRLRVHAVSAADAERGSVLVRPRDHSRKRPLHDLQPGRELPLVRPHLGHGRAGVAGNHRPIVAFRYDAPIIRAASTAALRALSTPTQATGTPGGICTMESSASRPSSTLVDERSGTPITGRSVCAATTPGSAAASPAPQISTLRPRDRAEVAYSATAAGSR